MTFCIFLTRKAMIRGSHWKSAPLSLRQLMSGWKSTGLKRDCCLSHQAFCRLKKQSVLLVRSLLLPIGNCATDHFHGSQQSIYHAVTITLFSWETLKIFPLRCRAGQGNPSLLLSVVTASPGQQSNARKKIKKGLKKICHYFHITHLSVWKPRTSVQVNY